MRVRSRRGFAIVLAIASAITCIVGQAAAEQGKRPIPGIVRQTEIRIAPDTTGRLASIAVTPGQHVHKGELLAVLDNPELTASVGEAKAAAASAKAERDRVYSGVRAEEVAIATQAVQTAEANLLLAKQTYARASDLAGKVFASKQTLDQSTASLAKAKADVDLKRAQAAKAAAGPTAEERFLADARVALAEATVADLEAQLNKTKLTAPADGMIGIRVAEPGEIIQPGKPVMTLEADGQAWFAFTLREDDLQEITVGKALTLTAQDGRQIDTHVTELRPLGEFATWRAARAVGDHDLNSFRLRLEPTGNTDGLEPGMTVWLTAQP
ncbi:biotin/lipoyl-binding protein [Phyllobacterium sp. SYP-B3895]|uniref:HlyD family secretion protein n=1 Tax=Phyllobacterium sp. SYP-B3895 TaxID=2663240 RepID=UPI001299DAB4|nr:HlyD family efflux transporter periplasmic adaptor subunit [Phyllobacterium sp. SYP-B3895]MRG54616.1 biotin/lipoyl-binding protein [Phyllobacterium sp. SYP-B3895]